jgi:peroxiredoxin
MSKVLRFSLALAFVLAAGVAGAQSDDEWGKPEDLLNKEAPKVKLSLVDGGELDLAKYRGEKYVVLDFWTTWCPWCRKSTEHFVKRAEQYKDEKVAFYMVSIGEEKSVVQDYLEKNDLDVNMALDPDRDVADRYWVDYIPHVVVINPEGEVIKVAVGEDKIGPAMDEALSEAFPDAAEAGAVE